MHNNTFIIYQMDFDCLPEQETKEELKNALTNLPNGWTNDETEVVSEHNNNLTNYLHNVEIHEQCEYFRSVARK